MNKKFSLLLVALVTLDIIDGDFLQPSALDIVKAVLYIVCFALLIWNGRGEKNDIRRES